MNFRHLFNIPITVPPQQFGPTPASKSANATGQSGSIGAFITQQTLVSFPVATSVIVLLWTLGDSLKLVQKDSEIYIGLVVSLVIGALIYYINVSDPKAPTTSRREKVIAAFIALLNTAVLLGAAKAVVMRG